MKKQAFRTLLTADDDPEDCLFANEALVEGGAAAAFTCIGDGIELMEYPFELSRSGEMGDALYILQLSLAPDMP